MDQAEVRYLELLKTALRGTIFPVLRTMRAVVIEVNSNDAVIEIAPLLDSTYDHYRLAMAIVETYFSQTTDYNVHEYYYYWNLERQTRRFYKAVFSLHQESVRLPQTIDLFFEEATRLRALADASS